MQTTKNALIQKYLEASADLLESEVLSAEAVQAIKKAGDAVFLEHDNFDEKTVWHSAKEVCEALGISRTSLARLTFGEVQKRNGKEYSYEPVVKCGIKYTLEGRGKQVFYNDAALGKLKKHLGKTGA
jgi:hypothetical protein